MERGRGRWLILTVASASLACVLLVSRREPLRAPEQHASAAPVTTLGPVAATGRGDASAATPLFGSTSDQATPAPRGLRIRGRVWIWSGWSESGHAEPLAGIDLLAEREEVEPVERAVRGVTGPRGEFELVLAPGEWCVSLRPQLSFSVRTDEEPMDGLAYDAWPRPATDAPKELRIVVSPTGSATSSSAEVGAWSGVEPVQLLVRAESVLGGRVVEDVSGAPVPGASVVIGGDERGGGLSRTVSDALGRFWLITEVREAMTTLAMDRLLVTAAGWAPAALATNLGYSFPSSRSVTDLEVRLRRPLRLEGRAIGPDGQGVAEVRLEVLGRLGDADAAPDERDEVATAFDPLRWSWGAKTDPQGAFVVEGLTPNVSPQHGQVRLIARAEGWIQLAPYDVLVGPGTTWFTVRLAREAAVAGQLVDGAGVPLEGWISRPIAWKGPRFRFDGDDGRPLSAMDGASGELSALREIASRGRLPSWFRLGGQAALAGADGQFTLEGLAPGAHEVVVHAPGHAERVLQVEAPVDLGRVVLSSERRLRGRVVDSGGSLVPDALVRALRVQEGRPSPTRSTWPDPNHVDLADERGASVTDRRGEFEIGGLGQEPVDLVVFHGAARALRAAVRPGQGEVEITVDPAPTLEVLLQARDAADGRQLAVELEARSADGSPLPVRELAGGVWEVTAAGAVGLVVDHEGYARFVRWVDAEAAGHRLDVRRRIDLGPVALTRAGGRVHVRASPPATPLASFEVEVVRPGVGQVASGRLPRDRRTSSWSSPLLEPGAYTVRVTEVGWDGEPRHIEREVRVQQGAELEVDFGARGPDDLTGN